MAITHVTAHLLNSAGDGQAQLKLRNQELNIDESKEELLDQLKSSFLSRLNRKHGSFCAADDAKFLSTALKKHLDNQLGFTELSSQFMNKMEESVKESHTQINAHFLFFIDTFEHQSTFYIFVVHQSESLAIDDKLEITPSYYVDTGISLFGIKVDISEWQRRSSSAYMTIIPPRGKPELADAFHTLTDFSNIIDTEEATLAFLEGVESYTQHLEDDKKDDYRKQVVDYCKTQEKNDAPVSIRSLSNAVEGIDCEQFIKEMLPHNPLGKNEDEIVLDRRSLTRYVRFSGKERDLAISFSSSLLSNRIEYSASNDTLTIKGIPHSLRQQLRKHLGITE